MHRGLLALNIVLLLGLGVLYFLFFTKKDNAGETIIRRPGIDSAVAWQHTPVAYFEMDSIEANFIEFRKMHDVVLKREKDMNDTINAMKANLQMQVQKLQEQESKMTPDEIKNSRQLLENEDEKIKRKEKELTQDYQQYYMNMQQGILIKIKNYCKELNKDNRYSYIFVNEPTLFFYTDTAHDITAELVKGLNEYYRKGKKD